MVLNLLAIMTIMSIFAAFFLSNSIATNKEIKKRNLNLYIIAVAIFILFSISSAMVFIGYLTLWQQFNKINSYMISIQELRYKIRHFVSSLKILINYLYQATLLLIV